MSADPGGAPGPRRTPCSSRYIDLPANLALNEALMAGKDALLARFDRFLARWPLAV